MINIIIEKIKESKTVNCNFCQNPILNLSFDNINFISKETKFTPYFEKEGIGKAILIQTVCEKCKKENTFEKVVYCKTENIDNGIFEFYEIYNEDYKKEENFIYKKVQKENKTMLVNNNNIIMLENIPKDSIPRLLESLLMYENLQEERDINKLIEIVRNKKLSIAYLLFLNFYIENEKTLNEIIINISSLTKAIKNSHLSNENKLKLLNDQKEAKSQYIIRLGEGIDLISNVINKCDKNKNILDCFLLEYGRDSNEKEIDTLSHHYFPILINKEKLIQMLIENEIFNHSLIYEIKSVLQEDIVIYKPYKENKNYKQIIENKFLEFIKEHLEKIDNNLWSEYENKASLCDMSIAGQEFLMEYKDDIKNMTRYEFVNKHVYQSNCLEFELKSDKKTVLLGELNGEAVYYNPRGMYFYYNEEIDTVFEILLTMPSKCL